MESATHIAGQDHALLAVQEDAAPDKYLVSSAYMYGNLMALINDNMVDPHNRMPPFQKVRDANVCVREFRIG